MLGRVWPVKMAWRETRGAWRHFVYLLACVTLGVGALVAVGSFADSLERSVGRSAKSLLGADVEIRATRPLSPAAAQVVADLGREGVAVARVQELAAMVQAGPQRGGPAQLVEVKAVEAGYPFYGRLVTDPDRPLAELIGSGRALVHESLLTRLGLSVGDRLRLGEAELVVAGVIRQEPDREELRVRQVRKLAVDEDDSLLRARCGAGIMGVSVYVHTFVYRTGPMASR